MSASQVSAQDTDKPMAKGKVLIRLVIYLVILGAILFGAAGTLSWTFGWAYLAVYGRVTLISMMVVPLSEELAEERTHVKQDAKNWDKALAGIGQILYPLALIIVGGLDKRFGWSGPLPPWLRIAALVLAGLFYLIPIWASAVNRFYSRFVRIQRDRGHKVVSAGPYRFVRHPAYAALLVHITATALALESLWTLVPAAVMCLLLIVRTSLEDRTLQEELEGYREYAKQVRYRLIPGIW